MSVRSLLLLVIALLGVGIGSAQRVPIGTIYGPVPVTAVLDGDTIVVASNVGPRRVRLIGIDAPEQGQSNAWGVGLGAHATQALTALLPPDRLVWLELDLGIDDVYGRLLAYVYVADPAGEWLIGDVPVTQLNLAMVRSGLAQTMTVLPNQRYAHLYELAEGDARAFGLGFWAEGSTVGITRPDLAPLPDGPIVIECALYNPTTPNDEAGEWVSLWVREPHDTTGYRLYDAGSGQSFFLPAGMQPMGEIRVDNPGQGVWNNSGDTIYLMLGDRVVDQWDYSDRLAPEGSIICRGQP